MFLKDYIEERAVKIAHYIIDSKATVRQTAKKFGISKSTVHTDVVKWNAIQMSAGDWKNLLCKDDRGWA